MALSATIQQIDALTARWDAERLPYVPWPFPASSVRHLRRIGRPRDGNPFTGLGSGAFAADFYR